MPRITRRLSLHSRSFSLTAFFIALNIAIYLAFLGLSIYSYFTSSSAASDYALNFLALNPRSVVEDSSFLTLFTSMFSHFSLGHLAVNMISLFFIGSFVERLIGRKRYFWFYIASGLLASAFFVGFAYIGSSFESGRALFGGIDDSAVGASGALFGLGGLLAVLVPRLPVLAFFVIPMPLWAAMALLLFGFWAFSFFGGLPVGNTAHFGGLIAGLLYGWYLRTKYARKVVLLNRMFTK